MLKHEIVERKRGGVWRFGVVQNFQRNPYFNDAKLTKVFSFSDDGTTSVSGFQPKWKSGMVRFLGFGCVVHCAVLDMWV